MQVRLALGDCVCVGGGGNQAEGRELGINPWRVFDGKFKSLPLQYFDRDNTRKSIHFAFPFISVNFALTSFPLFKNNPALSPTHSMRVGI